MVKLTTHDRAAALAAGLDAFWQWGFHGTSMKDLERATGMHPGSIYAAFGSKRGFYVAALDRYTEDVLADLRRHASEAASPIEGLAGFVEAIALDEDRSARSCMLVKTLLEHGEGDETLRRSAESGIAAIETEIGNDLRRAQQRGEVSASLEVEHAARRIQLNIMGLRSFACRPGANESVAVMAHDIASEIRKLKQVPS